MANPSYPPPVLSFHTSSTPTPTPCALVSTRCDTRRPSLVDLILCFFFICLNTKKKSKKCGPAPRGSRLLLSLIIASPLPSLLHPFFYTLPFALTRLLCPTLRGIRAYVRWTFDCYGRACCETLCTVQVAAANMANTYLNFDSTPPSTQISFWPPQSSDQSACRQWKMYVPHTV